MTGGRNEGTVDEERLAELLELLGEDPEGGQALELFLASVPTRLADLGEALAAGRMTEAARVAHSVRGSAAAFAAARLASLAGGLESRCVDAGPSAGVGDADQLVAPLEAEFASFRVVLEARASEIIGAAGVAPAPGTEDGER